MNSARLQEIRSNLEGSSVTGPLGHSSLSSRAVTTGVVNSNCHLLRNSFLIIREAYVHYRSKRIPGNKRQEVGCASGPSMEKHTCPVRCNSPEVTRNGLEQWNTKGLRELNNNSVCPKAGGFSNPTEGGVHSPALKQPATRNSALLSQTLALV